MAQPRTRQPRWLNAREQRAWRGFLAMHAQLDLILRRALQKEAGLSDSDYAVLVSLSEAPQGRLRAFEILDKLQWEKSRLSHHIRRMEERGLVKREGCDTDRRGAHVTITKKGKSSIECAAPGHAADVRRTVFDALSKEQVDQLADISETVLRHLERLEQAE